MFSVDVVDGRQPHPDRLLEAALGNVAEDLRTSLNGGRSFSERVRRALSDRSNLVEVDRTAVAHDLGVGLRTLRRRLNEEGSPLPALVNQARSQRAQEELGNSDDPVEVIAERLGYAEVSSFHRAFKRWTGQTVGGYRQRARASGSQPDSPALHSRPDSQR